MKEIKENIAKDVVILCERYPALESVKEEIVEAYFLLAESYKNGGKLLVAGNGGSAADAEHIVGELMKGFKLPRKPQAEFAEKLVRENAELGTGTVSPPRPFPLQKSVPCAAGGGEVTSFRVKTA